MSLPERTDDWPFSYSDRVRFGDLDAMRHLNNVEFLRFFESARIAYITTLFPDHEPANGRGWGLIFAEAHVNYRAPAFFDESIRTYVRPEAVKRSSFRMAFEMRAEHDGRLLAEGWGALVGYDYAAERAAPLPDEVRESLHPAGRGPA